MNTHATALRPAGTGSLVAGIASVVLICSIFVLPELWPVFYVTGVVAGLWAMGAAGWALRRVRRGEEAASVRVRAGLALGALSTTAALGLFVWALWALDRAYSR
ncbi:hypothetical protein [Streptomyces bambusae]|uniref:DUF4190 domain-containing protein n=1 Tax=Streptomyces bambusae TaxID=1550616 RepID=A0ABS6Z5Q1_9ACTN|nr:hypothetical protein [Streptomyces bambusae]MBW5483098.1 hypothetical protein [Streptomyces bambusae]